jgi:hypothetical protein
MFAMSLSLNFEWEEAAGKKTLSNPTPGSPAAEFQDAPAKQTARQSAFYRNLIRLAEQTGSKVLPIAFTNARWPRSGWTMATLIGAALFVILV